MKKSIIFMCLLCFAFLLEAQQAVPALMWQDLKSNVVTLRSLVEADDGNIVAWGHDNRDDAYLIKYDLDGTVIWQRRYGSPDFREREYSYSGMPGRLIGLSDGGFAVFGQYNDFVQPNTLRSFMAKFDRDGQLEWELKVNDGVGFYGGTEVAGGFILATTFYQTLYKVNMLDGSVISTTPVPYRGFFRRDNDGRLLAKNWLWGSTIYTLDEEGTVLSSRNFQVGGGWKTDFVPTPDGGFIFSKAVQGIAPNGYQASLVKTDSLGNMLWTKEFGGTGEDHFWGVEVTSKGDYIAIGETTSYGQGNYDDYIVKVNADGDLLYEYTLGGVSADWGEEILEIDGDLYIGGLNRSNGGTSGEVLKIRELLGPSTVVGKLYYDLNEDGQFDPLTENGVAYQQVQIGAEVFVQTDAEGNYTAVVEAGDYLVESKPSGNWEAVPNTALSLSLKSGETSSPVLLPLANQANCEGNISLTGIPLGIDTCNGVVGTLTSPCPGNLYQYCVNITNNGTKPLQPNANGTILIINIDPNMVYNSLAPSTTCNWNVSPNGNQLIITGSAIPGGQSCTICFDVDVVGISSPYITTASLDYFCQPNGQGIVTDTHTADDACACDPNDMTVWPAGCGDKGFIPSTTERLMYRTRFENEGTGPAHHVYVEVALDDDLDYNSLRILESSHEVTGFQLDAADKLLIYFNDIELEAAEKGYVYYTLNPKPNLAEGTEIRLEADIYFDANVPVETNEVLNTMTAFFPSADFAMTHSPSNPDFVYDFDYSGTIINGQTYYWEFGTDANPSTSTVMNPTNVMFTDEGPHNVRLVVDRDGCVVESMETLLAESYITGNKAIICHNGLSISVSLNAIPAHIAHGDVVGPCSDETTDKGSSRLAPSPVFEGASLQVSPNPASDHVFIQYTGLQAKKSLVVYDLTGRKVSTVKLLTADGTLRLDLEDLSSGVYFLMGEDENGKVVKLKFLKG